MPRRQCRYATNHGLLLLSSVSQWTKSSSDFDMKAAVYHGLFADLPDKPCPVTPAKCAWKTYHTLGLCNSCNNITSEIQTDAADTKHTLPDGLSLRSVDSYGQVLHRYNATVKEDPETDTSLILTFLAVWFNETSGTDPNGISAIRSRRCLPRVDAHSSFA